MYILRNILLHDFSIVTSVHGLQMREYFTDITVQLRGCTSVITTSSESLSGRALALWRTFSSQEKGTDILTFYFNFLLNYVAGLVYTQWIHYYVW